MTDREPPTRADPRVRGDYESVRLRSLDEVSAATGHRRVTLAPDLALLFLSPALVRTALEEALRAERVDDRARIEAETQSFSALLPRSREVVAVLTVTMADPADLAVRAAELRGVAESVALEIEGLVVRGRPDDADDVADGDAAVAHVVRFGVDDSAATSLDALGETPRIVASVDHWACRASATLDARLCSELCAELTG